MLLFAKWYVCFHQEGNSFFVDTGDKTFKRFKTFEFINQQRIFLFVYRILHRLFQIIHVAQVFFPLLIDDR